MNSTVAFHHSGTYEKPNQQNASIYSVEEDYVTINDGSGDYTALRPQHLQQPATSTEAPATPLRRPRESSGDYLHVRASE